MPMAPAEAFPPASVRTARPLRLRWRYPCPPARRPCRILSAAPLAVVLHGVVKPVELRQIELYARALARECGAFEVRRVVGRGRSRGRRMGVEDNGVRFPSSPAAVAAPIGQLAGDFFPPPLPTTSNGRSTK